MDVRNTSTSHSCAVFRFDIIKCAERLLAVSACIMSDGSLSPLSVARRGVRGAGRRLVEDALTRDRDNSASPPPHPATRRRLQPLLIVPAVTCRQRNI